MGMRLARTLALPLLILVVCLAAGPAGAQFWQFDGSTSYVTMGDGSSAAVTLPDSDWTIAGWVNLDAWTSHPNMVSMDNSTANPFSVYFYNWVGITETRDARVNFGAVEGPTGGAEWPTTTWTHLTIVRSGTASSATIYVYKDGSLYNTSSTSDWPGYDPDVAVNFGRRTDASRYLDGAMAYWAKWDRALTTGEITTLQTRTPDQVATPAWYVTCAVGEGAEEIGGLTLSENSVGTSADGPPVSASSTYYVDNTAAGASDSNDGSSGSPWLTLGHANTTAADGDTIHVVDGTYAERITVNTDNLTWIADTTDVTTQGFQVENAPGTTIDGFTITSETYGNHGGGVWIAASDDTVVQNCRFINCWGPAVCGTYVYADWSDNVTVQDNYVYRSGAGIYCEGTNWTVSGNDIERLYRWGSSYTDCDYTRANGTGHTISGNHGWGTICTEIGQSHTDGCQIFDNDDAGAPASSGTVIEGNYFEGFDQGVILSDIGYAGVDDITIRNNIFRGVPGGATEGYHLGNDMGGAGAVLAMGATNVKVYNNTFVDIENTRYDGVSWGWTVRTMDGASSAPAATLTAQNNIFYQCITTFVEQSGSITEDYNLADQDLNGGLGGANDVTGDPLFVDVPAEDFALQAASPAVNAGTTVASVTVDYAGNSRPVGAAYDLGAYELQTPPPGIYYIDATDGDDGAAGTSASTAWQTIAKVNATAVNAGDQYLFQRGETWTNERLIPSAAGTAANPVVFGAYGTGADPVIDAGTAANAVRIRFDYITIQDLYLTGGTSDCIDTYNVTGITVDGCTIADPGRDGVYWNLAADSTLSDSDISGCRIGVSVVNGSSGITLDGNNIHDNTAVTDSDGVSINGSTGIVVQNNAISGHNNGDSADNIQITTGSEVTVRYNTFSDSYNSDIGMTSAATADIYYNLFKGSYRHCLTAQVDANGLRFRNNTIAGGYINGIRITAVASGGIATVENNIVTDCINLVSFGAVSGTITSDYNLFWPGTETGDYEWGGSNYTTLAAYQSASSQDANSSEQDPLFADAAGGDYSLQGTSPAIDAGTTVSYTKDITGQTLYLNSGFDAGAYESAATTGPTAAFTGFPLSGTPPLTVQFVDQSTAGTSPIVGYTWGFGDGTVGSTAQNPTHIFGSVGTYDVSLRVTDGTLDDQTTYTGMVTVTETTGTNPPTSPIFNPIQNPIHDPIHNPFSREHH